MVFAFALQTLWLFLYIKLTIFLLVDLANTNWKKSVEMHNFSLENYMPILWINDLTSFPTPSLIIICNLLLVGTHRIARHGSGKLPYGSPSKSFSFPLSWEETQLFPFFIAKRVAVTNLIVVGRKLL